MKVIAVAKPKDYNMKRLIIFCSKEEFGILEHQWLKCLNDWSSMIQIDKTFHDAGIENFTVETHNGPVIHFVDEDQFAERGKGLISEDNVWKEESQPPTN